MYARRTRSFSGPTMCSSRARMNKSNFRQLLKLCSEHVTVCEVVHRNVDPWIQSLA